MRGLFINLATGDAGNHESGLRETGLIDAIVFLRSCVMGQEDDDALANTAHDFIVYHIDHWSPGEDCYDLAVKSMAVHVTDAWFTMCDRRYKRHPAPSLFKAPGGSGGMNKATA